MAAMVRLMHYAASWPQEFEQTKSGILQSCAGDVVAVEHIGSTAIPGLIARPVIDIVACVRVGEVLDDAAERIEGLYFRRVDAPLWCRRDSIQMQKPRHGEATHQVLLTTLTSRTFQRTLAVRDHLRRVPARAVDFEEAKVRGWKHLEGALDPYERDKAIFFAHLEDQLGLS